MPAAIQVVRFRPKPEVAHDNMIALNERFQRAVVPGLPGLERREACVTDDGEWVLVLRYATMELATAPPQITAWRSRGRSCR